MNQRLVIPDFPQPMVARVLSPNGRAHWRKKREAVAAVKVVVRTYALMARLQPMRGMVELQPTWVYPQRRKRDDDNLGTGVLKATRDALVEGGYLAADDVEHLRQLPAVVEVKPKQRELILEFRSVEA